MSWLSSTWHWYAIQKVLQSGAIDHPNAALVNPLGAGIGGTVLIGIALWQAGIAWRRHQKQTDADLQRSITESFSKATEQLGSDKIEVRLGGIYTLARISRGSSDDYWTVMETLCAFVRERAFQRKPETAPTAARFDEKTGETKTRFRPPTDIAAVLAIIVMRDKKNYRREKEMKWQLDFREANLRGANLANAKFSKAIFGGTDLREAYLSEANLTQAYLGGADLREAILVGADLRRAMFLKARLAGALLVGANISGIYLTGSDLRGANLTGAIFLESERAFLEGQLFAAVGDATTRLPDGLARPEHWSVPYVDASSTPPEPDGV